MVGDIASYTRLMEFDEGRHAFRVMRISAISSSPALPNTMDDSSTTGDGFIMIFDSPLECALRHCHSAKHDQSQCGAVESLDRVSHGVNLATSL
jgi:hypothetical protein